MTHTDLLRQALDALELQEPAVGCPREREHWRRTAMPTIAALRAALAAPVEPVRELLIQAAALAVVAERQGKYPGAAQVADEVLKAQPAIDGFGGNLDEMFDAPAVPLTDEQIKQAVTAAVKSGACPWMGYEKDDDGRYTLPVLSAMHYGIARAVLAAPAVLEPLTAERLQKHAMFAADAPPASAVVLVSSLHRLLGITGDSNG